MRSFCTDKLDGKRECCSTRPSNPSGADTLSVSLLHHHAETASGSFRCEYRFFHSFFRNIYLLVRRFMLSCYRKMWNFNPSERANDRPESYKNAARKAFAAYFPNNNG